MNRTEHPATRIVRENPKLSTEQLLEKLHAAGHTDQTKKTIMQSRWRLRQRAGAPAKDGGPGPRAGTAGEFIVTLPATLSHEEAYARVVEAGYDVSIAAVYKTRRQYKHLLREAPEAVEVTAEPAPVQEPRPAPAPTHHRAQLATRRATDGARAELAAAILRVGLDATREVMAEVERLMERISRNG